MNPIDKFTNIDAVYPTIDAREEDIILDYVWDFAMLIHPAEPKIIDERFALEGSCAISVFKRRYNERLIKIPLTYKDYKTNKEIQTAISALQLDVDKFWFAILFIWDYVDGECWQAFERVDSPANEINRLLQTIAQYEVSPNANPLTDHIVFKEELSLSLQVNGKSIHTIETANAIKFILSCCQEHLDDLRPKNEFDTEHLNDNIEMVSYYPTKKQTTASTTKRICLFAQKFQLFFDTLSPSFSNYRKGERSAYNVTFLISQLVYLTGISDNEDFQTDKRTLKGYLSKNKNMNWDVHNNIY
ncbi:MAG: hypothetical protein EGP71_00660 [Bacteroides thetaiotaomicron]|nr:hypothetical protein [Bacteroides thetaiotaomicron]